MSKASYMEALQALDLPLSSLQIEKIREGLINDSYKVSDRASGQVWFLQKINRHVFPEPAAIQQNYRAIIHHLDNAALPFRVPRPIMFSGKELLFTDNSGEYWRAVEYIPSAVTLQQPENTEQAAEVAASFALFIRALSTLDATKITPTLPGFHDLGLRYRQFLRSFEQPFPGRAEQCLKLVAQLQARKHYVSLFEKIQQSDRFPTRLMHHDAKIGNVLFGAQSHAITAIVDLDTVMPGYFFSDLGDMIRSMAGSIPEDGHVHESVTLRPAYYEAITVAYRDALGPVLTDEERKHLHYSGILMIYMQSLRFLTDFLSGDTYYQCNYPGQNLDRTKNQLALLQALEDYLNRQQYLPHD